MSISASEEAWATTFRANNQLGHCFDCINFHFPVNEQCVMCIDIAYQEAAEMAMDYEAENGYDNYDIRE